MDQLQQMMQTIREQLSKLSATQRMLIASLAVLLAMTLFLVSQYAGQKQYVDLLPVGAGGDEVQKAAQFLSEYNIEHRLADGRPQVAPERRRAVIAQMGQAGALPGDTSMLFADLIDKQSWTMSGTQQRQMYTIALQNELSSVISQMRGISSANVLIDAPERRGIGAAVRTPTASVTVTHGGEALNQDTVDAIASIVSGAKSGLSITNVTVVDAVRNRSFKARSEDSMLSGTYLELQTKFEKLYRERLLETLAYIDGVIVAVSAQVDATSQVSNTTAVLPPGQGTVTAPRLETEHLTESRSGITSGEPGVRSNAGLDIATGGNGGTDLTESDTQAEYLTEFGRRTETTRDPRGKPTKLNATISVPRSHVLAQYRVENGEDGEDPDAATLAQFFDSVRTQIEQHAMPLLETQSADGAITPGAVSVAMIPDPAPLAGGNGAGYAAGLGGGGGGILASGLVKTVALGAMALVSLGLMAMALKKAGKRPDLPSPEELVGIPPALEQDAEVMGEAAEAEAALAGIELTDDDVQRQQMLEQVAHFVEESPDDAAVLFQRWASSETR